MVSVEGLIVKISFKGLLFSLWHSIICILQLSDFHRNAVSISPHEKRSRSFKDFHSETVLFSDVITYRSRFLCDASLTPATAPADEVSHSCDTEQLSGELRFNL